MEQIEKKKRSKDEILEILVVILLGLTALLTAWATWIGSLHGGNQATNYAKSSNISADGNARWNQAAQELATDMQLWNTISDLRIEYSFAEEKKDTTEMERIEWKLNQIYADNVSENLQKAIDWADEQEEYASPFEMEGYVDSYFADAVFLGDSRTEGFHLYSGLEEGQYLYAVGATVESVFTKETQETENGKVPILDALAELECGKVYIMLGVNELGWPRSEVFQEQYGKVIDRVREDHPETEVVIQSLLPVSAKQEAKGSYVNNGRIAVYNGMLEELSAEKDCPYLNVAEAVTGEDGCLRPELTTDGVHLNTRGCQAWLEYLKDHPLQGD